MHEELAVVSGHVVRELIAENPDLVLATVADAYRSFAAGEGALPHSLFLPMTDAGDRIIALPARTTRPSPAAGLKWIASFPHNLGRGLDRASAVVVLNDPDTGRPLAIMDGGPISAARTGAFEAVAVAALHGEHDITLAVVGAGPINFEVVRYIAHRIRLKALLVHDTSPERADHFIARAIGDLEVSSVSTSSLDEALHTAGVVSFATNARRPHVAQLPLDVGRGLTILHVSLRDLTPDLVRQVDNVVDDIDHVCRERTSLHIAEQEAGSRAFIRCTLADVLNGQVPARTNPSVPLVFSPFGLGVLDIAVAALVFKRAVAGGRVATLGQFFDQPWLAASTNSRRPILGDADLDA